MSLRKRLHRLESIASAHADDRAHQADRDKRWCEVANAILATMPPERTWRIAEEVELDEAQWGPITRRVCYLADLMAAGLLRHKPLHMYGLPEGVCQVLEAHPDASYTYCFDCEDCGLETPHRSYAAMDRLKEQRGSLTPADRAYLTVCPSCGGRVGSNAHQAKRLHETWQRQLAEIEAKKAGPTGRITEGSTP